MNDGITLELVGSAAIDRVLQDIADLGGKNAAVNIRETTGLLGRVCAERTQPVVDEGGGSITPDSQSFSGFAPAAKKMGQAAVAVDMNRVYRTLSSVFKEVRQAVDPQAARAFYGMVKRGELDQAERFLRKLKIRISSLQISQWDGGKRHKQMRNSRGRVNKSITPVIIAEVEALRAGIKTVQNHVGYAKSGWINAARRVPGAKGVTRAVPAWVKNQNGPGTAVDGTRSGKDPYVMLTNQVPYVSKIFGGRQQSLALKGFDDLLIKNFRKQADHLRAKHARHLAAA